MLIKQRDFVLQRFAACSEVRQFAFLEPSIRFLPHIDFSQNIAIARDAMISSDVGFQNMAKPLAGFFVTSLLAIFIKLFLFPTTPEAFANAFDPLLCASLHNRIAEFLTPAAHAVNNTTVCSFFNLPGEEARRSRALRRRLSPEM